MAINNVTLSSSSAGQPYVYRRFEREWRCADHYQPAWFQGIVGANSALRDVLGLVERVAPTDSTVLVEGETGTGKELIAKAIHQLSSRRNSPFIKLNCAAIPPTLLESELFGHERGAFTGAITRRVGRFEAANGGTLFLDEIGDIPLELQSKLLRVMQEQEFERLGSTATVRVDVRVVAATNQDLQSLVSAKQFRMDLFYRLNVFPIFLPPLRERHSDIPVLAQFFVGMFSHRMGKVIETIPDEALEALGKYSWPGNIRELQNIIERSVVETSGDILQLCPLPDTRPSQPVTLAEAECDHILNALRDTNWVVGGPSGAAARLGMKRTTLLSTMKKRGISRHVAYTYAWK
jgi:formate hydrogenlyase transcriptional activator